MVEGQSGIAWPKKTRELHNHHFDSSVWNDFTFRDDDIVIATYAKAGTTWMQQIVAELVFNGRVPDEDMGLLSPWLDLRVPSKAEKLANMEAQAHRRFLKTHLPVDALVFSPKVKYLYIGRDGRDIAWSLYHHHAKANNLWYQALNDTPGLVGPPMGPAAASVREFFFDWLRQNGHPFWPFWENVTSWWAIRHLPNVRLVHFAALKTDLAGQMRRIAHFLDLPIEEAEWDAMVERCGFAYMKAHAGRCVASRGALWEGGASTFINKGISGRWRDSLQPHECAEYERCAAEALGGECAQWLATGVSAGTECAAPAP